MRYLSLVFILLFCGVYSSGAQNRISGFVRDSVSFEPLVGAYVIRSCDANAVVSDVNGYFSIIVPYSNTSLSFSYVGYATKTIDVTNQAGNVLTVWMHVDNVISEVVVSSKKAPATNMHTLSNEVLTSLPMISGKPDVGKALQILPGIESPREASSELVVRGGGVGENLYLLDGVPITHVHHIGGFYSVFNSDIINDVSVYKSAFPARYGGKLSSVVSISQREGSKSSFNGSFDIGVTDAAFTLEGPIIKNKMSFIFCARKTMIDPLMAFATASSDMGYIMYYGFYDVNAKIAWDISDKGKIILFSYQGDDYIKIKSDKANVKKGFDFNRRYAWGNNLSGVRWQQILNSGALVTNSLSYSNYRVEDKSELIVDKVLSNDKARSSLQNILFQTSYKLNIAQFYDFSAGGSWSHNFFNRSFRENNSFSSNNLYSSEIALFSENYFSLPHNLFLQSDLRFVHFRHSNYVFNSLEPRISFGYVHKRNHSFSIDYSLVRQFNHLLTSRAGIYNNELWLPASHVMPPSSGNHYSVGWAGNFRGGLFSAGSSIYYKRLTKLVVFKDGHESFVNNVSSLDLFNVNGIGEVAGFETYLNKTKGYYTGSVSYSYCNSTRKFNEINNAMAYPYEYTAKHNISLFVHRQLSEKWSVGASWTYNSGLPYTPVIAKEAAINPFSGVFDDVSIEEALVYGSRNSATLSDYHRMDVAFKHVSYTSRNKYKQEWRFGVYNLYNRHNAAYYRYVRYIGGPGFTMPEEYMPINLYSISYFPIIPTVSYKIYFSQEAFKSRNRDESWSQRVKNWFFYEN